MRDPHYLLSFCLLGEIFSVRNTGQLASSKEQCNSKSWQESLLAPGQAAPKLSLQQRAITTSVSPGLGTSLESKASLITFAFSLPSRKPQHRCLCPEVGEIKAQTDRQTQLFPLQFFVIVVFWFFICLMWLGLFFETRSDFVAQAGLELRASAFKG